MSLKHLHSPTPGKAVANTRSWAYFKYLLQKIFMSDTQKVDLWFKYCLWNKKRFAVSWSSCNHIFIIMGLHCRFIATPFHQEKFWLEISINIVKFEKCIDAWLFSFLIHFQALGCVFVIGFLVSKWIVTDKQEKHCFKGNEDGGVCTFICKSFTSNMTTTRCEGFYSTTRVKKIEPWSTCIAMTCK